MMKMKTKYKNSLFGVSLPSPDRQLKEGDSGREVRRLQAILNILLDENIDVDGNFNSTTRNLLCVFQTKYNLPVNGIYDQRNYEILQDI